MDIFFKAENTLALYTLAALTELVMVKYPNTEDIQPDHFKLSTSGRKYLIEIIKENFDVKNEQHLTQYLDIFQFSLKSQERVPLSPELVWTGKQLNKLYTSWQFKNQKGVDVLVQISFSHLNFALGLKQYVFVLSHILFGGDQKQIENLVRQAQAIAETKLKDHQHPTVIASK